MLLALPTASVDVLLGVMEEVEIGEEGVGNDLVPVEQLPWWVHFHYCDVVFVERSADGIGSCLQRSADMLVHTVTYRTMYLSQYDSNGATYQSATCSFL